jgi:LPXTG-site transpeptidase (sortase) family protein
MFKEYKKLIYVIICTIAAIFISGAIIVRGFFYAPSDEVTLPSYLENSLVNKANPNTTANLFPKILHIPAINVSANIQYVGITKKGNMATPNNFIDVGWYKYGPLPGAIGSAIIAGHVDDGFALPAVFSNLNKLKIGDNIYVETEGGDIIHFVVTDKKIYDYNAPTEDIFNQNDSSLLKLITCAGVWNEQYGTHDKRLVVTAVKSST